MTRLVLLSALLGLAVNGSTQTNSNAATTCDGNNFPITVGGPPPSCCQQGNDLYHVGRQGDLAHRRIGTACTLVVGEITSATTISTACGISGVNSPVHQQACTVGPCGTSIVKIVPGKSAHIFHPSSHPEVCGYQTTVTAVSDVFYPERYTNQTPYDSVIAKCPYTTCLSGGISAVQLTVKARRLTATGSVESIPPGIKFSGTGTRAHYFHGILGHNSNAPSYTAKLIASPRGAHARAVFSGSSSCADTGAYGKQAVCSVPLEPDPTVTVTYECEPGQLCETNTPANPSPN